MLQTDLDQSIIHTFAKAETGLGPSINLCWVDRGGEERREGGRDLVYGAEKTVYVCKTHSSLLCGPELSDVCNNFDHSTPH